MHFKIDNFIKRHFGTLISLITLFFAQFQTRWRRLRRKVENAIILRNNRRIIRIQIFQEFQQELIRAAAVSAALSAPSTCWLRVVSDRYRLDNVNQCQT